MRTSAYTTTDRKPTRREREKAARELDALMGLKLFRAFCEPVRMEILKVLTIHGRSDIATIAANVPQDRSVVSRHLSVLYDAAFVRREKVGRNVFFEMDGPAVEGQLEDILERFRKLIAVCCPGPAGL